MAARSVFNCFVVMLAAYLAAVYTGGAVGVTAGAILNQAYAKVATWGASGVTVGEGRSNNGQSFAPSSDAKFYAPKEESRVYHLPAKVNSKSATLDGVPSKVKGFQERFNPPPAFQFGESKGNNDFSSQPGPVYIPPKQASYDSPLSSYSPAASGIPDASRFAPIGPKYPPLDSSASSPTSEPKAPPTYQHSGYDSTRPGLMGPTPVPPRSPAAQPQAQTHTQYQGHSPHHEYYTFPAYVYDANASHADPSDYHDHRHVLDDLPEYPDDAVGPTDAFDHPSPWSHLEDDSHAYDDHPHFHPTSATTTTTTPPPPAPPVDENRVNKGHYSYYYLGRKLYYVPLYFSVYFIVYVTVLILKSIARHKVNFVHDLEDVNKGRSMDALAEQTTTAIVDFKRRYVAM